MARDRSRRNSDIDAPEGAGDDAGFLARWSRRKRAAEAPEQATKATATATHASEVPDAQISRDTPVAEKTDADMPPVDTLDENSDYSDFLSPKVSEELQRVALRKLFHLPKFNIVDGLDDYSGDYRNFTPLDDIKTVVKHYTAENNKGQGQVAREQATTTQAGQTSTDVIANDHEREGEDNAQADGASTEHASEDGTSAKG